MPREKTGVARLVFCDRHDASWIGDAISAGEQEDAWHLLLVGVSAAAYRQRFQAELAQLPHVSFVDTTSLAPAVQAEVSRYVLDLVARLPSVPLDGISIGERLERDGGNLWWSLEITEKSPFRGTLIERLFRLGLLARVLARTDYADLWVRITDEPLAGVIERGVGKPTRTTIGRAARPVRQHLLAAFPVAYWCRAAYAAVSAAFMRALDRPRAATGALASGWLAFFTIYPYWWLTPDDPERATDRFFSCPPGARAHAYVAWLSSPWRLWRNRDAVRRQLDARRILPLQPLLRLRDILALFDPRRFLALAAVHSRLHQLRAAFLHFEVGPLVASELRQSLCDAEIFRDELLRRAMRELSRRYRPAAVLYRAEGQPWESALVAAIGPQRSIGFFHSPFGRNYPALRFAPGDVKQSIYAAGRRPLPERALVCGEIARRYMVEDGYPGENIVSCGPQRHERFMKFLSQSPDRCALRRKLGLPIDATVYFVSLAIVEVETEGLFACLQAALHTAEAPHLVIKTHPNRPAGDPALHAALSSLGTKQLSFLQSSDDMYEYLAASNAMITIGSTVAFEAIALGVMPVVYEHAATYAATSLRAFESSLFVVDSPESMRRALRAVEEDGPEAMRRRASWPDALNQVFGNMTTPLEAQLDTALTRLGLRAQET